MQANGCRKSVQGRALCGDGGFATLCAVRVRLSRIFRASVLISAPLVFSPQLALAQFTQQGSKLVGTGAVGRADQGFSVALSADGNTAIAGGPFDNSNAGAAWVYTRSGGVWTQQGSKLVGTGAVGTQPPEQGYSVALSADGNTAIAGGPFDNSNAGAAWVFTRSGGVWTQQGAKLVGTGAVGPDTEQGYSVALSADGNTAIAGGTFDNSFAGAAWVFTRSGGVWTQQGAKLVGTGAVGPDTEQGFSVALSADSNTAFVGGRGDNSFAGAAWVFTRSGGVWAQQGAKLVGTGAVGPVAAQGNSVALSADGNTAFVGGPFDNSNAGAAWVFVQPPATVPFLAFLADLQLNIEAKPTKDGFALESSFTLSSTAPAINPLTQAVALQVSPFSATIPPGSFKQTGPLFTFAGVINGVNLQARRPAPCATPSPRRRSTPT
jgi:hypothetical protein